MGTNLKNLEDVKDFINESFPNNIKTENHESVVKLAQYLFSNFYLGSSVSSTPNSSPIENTNNFYASYNLGEIIEAIVNESRGRLPLKTSNELIVDFTNISAAPLRLVSASRSGGLELIYLSGRDGNKHGDKIVEWNNDINDISLGK